MDVVKPKPKFKVSRQVKVTVISVIFLLVILSFAQASISTASLSKKDLLISQVKHGDLAITVNGYGKLVSEKLQLLTSLTQATVEEIVLKPGAIVTEESVIVRLANPELALEVENAKQELAQLNANLRQLKVNNQRELLTEQAVIAQLASELEAATLKRTAEQTLVEKGIVSNLTFRQSQLHEKQLTKRISILTTKLEQLSIVHNEAINIQKERIKQQQGKLAIAHNKVEKLTVKAGFEGVLQRLSVNLGQSVAPGQELALIGSTKDLIAEIKIPQNMSSLVKLGQTVKIDTRQSIIHGTVARIDPIVTQNTVSIDINLPKRLPNNAKPQQNIDAEIISKTLKNINYIERPANLKAQSTFTLYQLNEKHDLAKRKSLKFGEKTGRYIEILSDVNEGDAFIISDLSNYTDVNIDIN